MTNRAKAVRVTKGEIGVCPFCSKQFIRATYHHVFCTTACRVTDLNTNRKDLRRARDRAAKLKRVKRQGNWKQYGPHACRLRAWLAELKSKPCMDCGGCFDAFCMDFDHRDPTQKKYNIGTMFANYYRTDKIESELAKCDLVCCNCHRIRTRDRRTALEVSRRM